MMSNIVNNNKVLRNLSTDPYYLKFNFTNNHSYCQIIHKGLVVTSASTLELRKNKESNNFYGNNIEAASLVASQLARKLKEISVTQITILNNKYRYHGKIKTLINTLKNNSITIH